MSGATERILVALRKESVDRNNVIASRVYEGNRVALRKESVDRNNLAVFAVDVPPCRSPQGERG